MSNVYYSEVEPILKGYQLLGDSQFVRFAEQLLGKKRNYRDGSAHIGLCVSGQKIIDLLNRVKDNFHPTTTKVILMIGTNDILRNTNVKDMRDGLSLLINELTERQVEKIIVLTIPPVPRLANSKKHWERLMAYNEFVKSLDNGYDILTLDVCSLFVRVYDYDDSRSPRLSRNNGSGSSNKNNEPDDSSESGNPSITVTTHQSSGMRNIILSSSPYFRSSSVERSTPDDEDAMHSNNDNLSASSSTTYKNLRISVGVKRKVVELDAESNESFAASDGTLDRTSDRTLDRTSDRTLDRTLDRSLDRSPDRKRRSYTSLAIDDHNDSFYLEDSYSEDQPKYKIMNDCFEEYFSGGNKRQDLIHLNRKGLTLIKYELYKLIG